MTHLQNFMAPTKIDLGKFEPTKIDWAKIEEYMEEQEDTLELILPPKETAEREQRLRRNALEKTLRRQAIQMWKNGSKSYRKLVDARRRGKLGK